MPIFARHTNGDLFKGEAQAPGVRALRQVRHGGLVCAHASVKLPGERLQRPAAVPQWPLGALLGR